MTPQCSGPAMTVSSRGWAGTSPASDWPHVIPLDVASCCREDDAMNKLLIAMSLSGLLSGCVGIPANVKAVEGFDAKRYVGTWYEIARLENRFEKGLEKVTAKYGLRDDGGLTVVNRGYNPRKDRWSEATGKAYFVGPPTRGRLKVSFF